ncbi:MAG TPA: hypothetical protein VNL77_09180 [Roseiflexaceae bacterium]|nr:hypothetical protein [Roseiflexaceae bacterium]
MPVKPDLVVFSHLRWDFVYQRPQHLLARLAVGRRVLFVEEPACVSGITPSRSLSRPAPGVLVCRPITPHPAPGRHDEHLATFRPLLRHLLHSERVEDYLAWFYTPLGLPLIQDLAPRAVVYDGMDGLSGLRDAPAELAARAEALLTRADLVFTGGPGLHHAMCRRHPHVHCFRDSADAAHFRLAREPGAEAEELRRLPRPRLEFCGVIDERVDLELLAALAEARPEWQIVVVGPAVGRDPEDMPRLRNIYYLGPRTFEEFIYRVWGRGVARHFAIPYNRKIWAVPLDQIETSWLEGRALQRVGVLQLGPRLPGRAHGGRAGACVGGGRGGAPARWARSFSHRGHRGQGGGEPQKGVIAAARSRRSTAVELSRAAPLAVPSVARSEVCYGEEVRGAEGGRAGSGRI